MGRRAFTLVELLVVLAILAVLLGMLLSVLGRARARARQAACQSNLRQLGNAFDLYLGDWEDVYPSPGGLYGERSYWDQGATGGLNSYLRSSRIGLSVWTCPELEVWDSRWEARTYTMNSYLREPPDVEPYSEAIRITEGIARAAIPEPASTLLLFEGIQHTGGSESTGGGYVYRCGDYTTEAGYHGDPQPDMLNGHRPWHGSQNNLLFVDGHVRGLAPMLRSPEAPGPGRNLWYVRRFR